MSERHRERERPGRPGIHKDWRTWVAMIAMLGAIGIYVLSLDDSVGVRNETAAGSQTP